MESLIAITPGSGANVSSQQVSINSQTVDIERSMMGVGVVELPDFADLDAEDTPGLYPANAIDLQGRYYIVLKNTFSLSTNSAVIRFFFYDFNSVGIGYSDEVDIANLQKDAGSSRYYGSLVVYANVFSAMSFKISLESITAGNITIFAGVV